MTFWEIIYFTGGGFLGFKFNKIIKKIIDRTIDSVEEVLKDIAEFVKKIL